tara:strand:- start:4452 stop:5174 length:723 start_codon:yes stop_codon:yes gene_type:complete
MDKIKILVVEDEIIIADNLCDTLNKLGYNTVEPALSYTEALQQIKKEQPDIAILDIELAGSKSGIDLAIKIKEDYDFPFIFLTSNADEATIEKVKKLNPPAYLIKPFTKEELYTSIEITLFNYSKKTTNVNVSNQLVKDTLFVKDRGVVSNLKFNDILYLKSSHVYTEIILKDNEMKLVRTSLNSIINNLNSDFIRIHRSYIININYLTQITKSTVNIKNETIPISPKFKVSLLNKVNLI